MTHTANNELTTGPGAPYAVGELVDITIRGARIVSTYLTSTRIDVGGDEFEFVDAPGVTFTRAEVDVRAKRVAGLRALADFVEANPDLPMPYGFHGQLEADSDDHVRALADRFGQPVDDAGTQFRTEIRFEGDVRFSMVHFRPEPVEDRHHADPNTGEACTMPNCDRAECLTPPAESGPELRTPEEWCATLGIKVVDPDGWRGQNARPWGDPISRDEFDRRAAYSTVHGWAAPTTILPTVTPLPGVGAQPVDDPVEESDGRCWVTTPDLTKPNGRHFCELYGPHPDEPHRCVCDFEWPSDQQPVPAPREAGE